LVKTLKVSYLKNSFASVTIYEIMLKYGSNEKNV